MKKLNIENLKKEAQLFCNKISDLPYAELFGVTDGKAIGTFIERKFNEFLTLKQYNFEAGNIANGLDFPTLNTDLKVTSIRQPQSSCPFKDSRQKIFGLGYNLLLFVYEKRDNDITREGSLNFIVCSFIEADRTADYQTTTGIHKILANNGNQDNIFAYLIERNIPGDEITLYKLAGEILQTPPPIGYLTISNALQWRLQYSRIVTSTENIKGIIHLINKVK